MKRNVLAVLFATCAVLLLVTVGADRAAAQGPAGAGASTAAKGSSSSSSSHSSHSLNPIKWVKKDKDSKNSPDSKGTRSDVEIKLTPKLQTQGILAANSSATDACASFTLLNDCLAALHASHNLGIDFNCLRASETGVHSTADVSGCKAADGEKPQSLKRAIHLLNPEADAKGATKNAEQQAKDDLKNAGV
jgi:hypothetical protein